MGKYYFENSIIILKIHNSILFSSLKQFLESCFFCIFEVLTKVFQQLQNHFCRASICNAGSAR